MCGIVTIACFGGQRVRTLDLHTMTDRLEHRGPDDSGYAWVDPLSGMCETWSAEAPFDGERSGILFGHRRLSILDLSRAGHQPMVNDDGSMVLAFNGEIFNFIELRKELESLGARFHSQTDTEVLLKAYEYWGEDSLAKLNGMWAFTLWDQRREALVISRDRFGVKPLYYTVLDGLWIFASEIKAILTYPGAMRGISATGVTDYLATGAVDHLADSLFRDIHRVPPAGLLELRKSGLKERKFWTLQPSVGTETQSDESRIETFRSLLSDAVRLRVRSDVPVGTMLSGGLDSSSIAALIHEQRLGLSKTGAQPAGEGLRHSHHAFSACWPGWVGDEEPAVDGLCDRFGLSCHKLYPSSEEVWELLPKVSYYLDEPFEFPISVVQYCLMRKARDQGAIVVLNGHGADETLCGYPARFVPVLLASHLLAFRPWRFAKDCLSFRKTEGWTHRRVLGLALGTLAERFIDRNDAWLTTLRGLPSTSEPPGLSPLGRSAWLSFSRQILPQWLRMEDRVSMACSVESRLPFLDYRLVEFISALPDSLKLNRGYTKFALRQAMKDSLPDALVTQRTKRFFGTPYQGWLRGDWRQRITDLFAGPCKVESYLEMKEFRKYLSQGLDSSGARFDASFIWRVISVEIWLRTIVAMMGDHDAGPSAWRS